ncbi:MAG: ribosome biogenesis GTPase YlqF [Lachnospiraceae bacterium]|nr:ribosome biogenesis GTPase YlqF [Lachnospiraceae bacterium]
MGNEDKTSINWYPGHMTKARRMMEEEIKLIDVVIELLDARAPIATTNPDIGKIAANKPRVVILNKSDLADYKANVEWVKYYKAQGAQAMILDSRSREGLKNVKALIEEATKEKRERDIKKGIIARPIRAMVAGIPNVGKSTFINAYSKKSSAATGNKPGVTKGKQWIKLGKDLELLDTPGILWPKIEDRTMAEYLAYIGTINDNVIPITEVATNLIIFLCTNYQGALEDRYNIETNDDAYEVLKEIGAKTGCMKKGGDVDAEKASRTLLDDFRNGKLGRITLQWP